MTEELTPAMRRWKAMLDRGYRIRPRLRVGPDKYMYWGPALYNPDGAFVQNIRRDTFKRLRKYGVIGDSIEQQGKEWRHDHSGTESPERGD